DGARRLVPPDDGVDGKADARQGDQRDEVFAKHNVSYGLGAVSFVWPGAFSTLVMRPSSIHAMRSANSKIRSSCVTTTSARSWPRANSRIKPITILPLWLSSALVGSSPTISFG